MLDEDTIREQLSLLANRRRTLADLVQQAVQFGGEVFVPPQTANEIVAARQQIRLIKATLRKSNVQIEDDPNDKAPRRRKSAQIPMADDVVSGDKVAGDKVGNDKVMGNKRSINTAGGDYAGGNIDKRSDIHEGTSIGVNKGIVNIYSHADAPSVTSQARDTSISDKEVGSSLDVLFQNLDLPAARPDIRNPDRGRGEVIGRQSQIEAIILTIEKILGETKTPRFITIEGAAGIGKSTIGWAVCYDCIQGKSGTEPRFSRVIAHKVDLTSNAFKNFIEKITDEMELDKSKTIEDRVIDIYNKLRNQVRGILFLIDGMPTELDARNNETPKIDGIVNEFKNFLAGLSGNSLAIVTTQYWRNRPVDPKRIILEGLSEHDIARFISEYGYRKSISDEQIKLIHTKTDGNTIALICIADALMDSSRTVEDILNDVNEGHLAESWIGPLYHNLGENNSHEQDQKDSLRQKIVKAMTLFGRYTTHPYPLADTIFYFDAQYSFDTATRNPNETEELLRRKDEFRKSVEQAIEPLVHARIVRTRSEDNSTRYFINDAWHDYAVKQINLKKESVKWRDAQCCAYAELRPGDRQSSESGWTIMTDYRSDGIYFPNYSHTDEMSTIIDIIGYCTSGSGKPQKWYWAASILDNYRASLLAAGLWEERIDHCTKVTDHYASIEKQAYIAARTARLLAWVYCYRDDFVNSDKYALYAKREASKGIQARNAAQNIPILPREIYVDRSFRQTYYKSLVNLGQIALREGYERATQGNRQENSKHKQVLFEEARKLFRLARWWLVRARGFVCVEFPAETYIVDYYLSEVDYYDRNQSVYSNQENRPKDMLLRAYRAFCQLLLKSIDWPPPPSVFHEDLPLDQMEYLGSVQNMSSALEKIKYMIRHDQMTNTHKRLMAHVLYYLGKSSRRLSQKKYNIQEREIMSRDAFEYLKSAYSVADKFHDHTIMARIEFAIAQWYEQDYRQSDLLEDKIESLELAEIHIREACAKLLASGLRNESEDANNFLNDRIKPPLRKLKNFHSPQE